MVTARLMLNDDELPVWVAGHAVEAFQASFQKLCIAGDDHDAGPRTGSELAE